MDLKLPQKSLKETFKFISTVISWTIFTLLIICAALLLYYFITARIYAIKGGYGENGEIYEPKFSLYTIVSPSMVPNINVYDVIVNTRVDSPKDIKIGDVITFTSTSTETMDVTVTHRVVSIIQDVDGNYSYQTKGDNNLIEDSSSVPYSNIIGRVALRIPGLGRIQLFVASFYGWLCLILIPSLYILLKGLFRRLKEQGIIKESDSPLYRLMTKPLFNKPKLLPPPKEEILESNQPQAQTILTEEINTVSADENLMPNVNQIESQQETEINKNPNQISNISIDDLFSNNDKD